MPKTLKCKIIGFFSYLILLLITVPTSAWAVSRTVDKVAEIEYAGTVLLFAAIFAGAITAIFIPTKVDAQLHYIKTAKIFIGLTFGLFASLFISSRYALDDVQMFLPAYFLASIGTPMMVYAVGIASDKETYDTIVAWLKQKFGMGGN